MSHIYTNHTQLIKITCYLQGQGNASAIMPSLLRGGGDCVAENYIQYFLNECISFSRIKKRDGFSARKNSPFGGNYCHHLLEWQFIIFQKFSPLCVCCVSVHPKLSGIFAWWMGGMWTFMTLAISYPPPPLLNINQNLPLWPPLSFSPQLDLRPNPFFLS